MVLHAMMLRKLGNRREEMKETLGVQATGTQSETKREIPSEGESVTRSDFWVVAGAPLSWATRTFFRASHQVFSAVKAVLMHVSESLVYFGQLPRALLRAQQLQGHVEKRQAFPTATLSGLQKT
jgi:hypothetical protein